jgi:metal-responsive CopG/Arc/MetJ family transcriptional regulator
MSKLITLRVPDALLEKIDRLAKEQGCSRSRLILKRIGNMKSRAKIQTDAIGRQGTKATVSRPIGSGHALGCRCTMCQLSSGKNANPK